ncbi:serine/threonine-protein kinase [Salsipaludibacter albus]|uniref:serine/threonine-protein kinase n=1 Tax=Salsipaludibacter albus TaxID=2849650 RepID=UPI001EE3B676|nr:serine/threonine-protein kinase [Salsipaludibacter albus]MBY5161287.1 serine/threonine protein kinase [Salsipaludibacter albus]
MAAVRLPGFTDFELLGEGGFATVYRARQADFDRDVAVKVLNVGLDARQRAAFERECRAMGVVSQHPHIVTVYSAGWTQASEPCIVMELFDRGTTADLLRADGAVDHAEVLDIGVKMCGALQTAHDRGVLHRDIKPQNIFLSAFGEPALGDFGISAFAGDGTGEGAGVGGFSIHYAAPEVIERRHADHLSDVYSLGATLYTLLAGRRPFATPGRSQSTRDVALRVLRETPPRLAGVPGPVAELVMTTLSKRPEERPASAASLGRELQALQESLGLTRTRFTVSGDAPTPSPAGAGPDLEEPTATVARPSQRTRASDEPERSPVSRRRLAISVAAGVVTIGGIGLLAWSAARTPPSDPVPTALATDDAVVDDDFFDLVATPTAVRLEQLDDGRVQVRWQGPEDATFEVQRVDGAAGDEAAMTAEASPLVLDDVVGQRPCVVVRALGANGRLSEDSPPACLGEAAPSPAPSPTP